MTTKQDLLDLRAKAEPLFRAAQEKMLLARGEKEYAEWEYKQAEIAAYGRTDGKNAEIRKAQVQADYDVRTALDELQDAERAFNAAYAEYKNQEAILLYIRDMTALLEIPD